MIGLTPQQQALLDFIITYTARHDGVSPSFAEMAAGVGIVSKGNIHKMLVQLEARGAIRRLPFRNRAIEIIEGACSLHAVTTAALVEELERRGYFQAAAA